MLVKLCGIRSEDHVDMAQEAGADFIGLNFVPSSKRLIEPDMGRRISQRATQCATVGVFQDQSIEDVHSLASYCELDYIQLHGDESPEFCHLVATKYRVIKALRATVSMDQQTLDQYGNVVSHFLIDGNKPGSGQRWQWTGWPAQHRLPRPFFLAGGLTPENVNEAISVSSPQGVDTASGIESEGEICKHRVDAFCQYAKGFPRSPEE